MVFKNFRFQVILRVALLVIAVTILAWCLVHSYYLRSVYAAVGVMVLIGEFIWYADRFNRDVKSFLVSLMQRDFTTHYQSTGKSRSFDEMYKTLNRISDAFQTVSAEKEVQFRFLEMLVEHLRVGILTLDENEKIHLANQALKDLLQKQTLFSLKSFETFDSILSDTVRGIRSGETRLIKLRVQNELLQLSVHSSEFILDGRYHKLVSMQNIRNELDAREMEGWQKLIRVLTHEIMNSVSPVISLSETLYEKVNQNSPVLQDNAELYSSLHKGLEAIIVRSQGLFNFTQSYRKLTGIPRLSLKETNIKDVINRVQVLLETRLSEKNIALEVSNVDMVVVVDPELMEHVLINLLLNAIDALSDTPEPRIAIHTFRGPKGSVCISIRDNGEGIDDATAEQIFIPFFTTRKKGSGIGLALTKQILQLHHGDIHFTSEKGKGTEFVIVL